MSTQFERPLYGFRFVESQYGDTLQAIAARELDDAARWTDLIAYNNLVPPFITDDPAVARAGVLLTGQLVLVPAPSPIISSTADPEKVFERDVRLLAGGVLATENGDLAIVSGRANLVQAIKHRLETEEGELVFHMEYGSRIRRLIGTVNGPTAVLLAAKYGREAVESDPRIERVVNATATVNGDAVRVTVNAEPVAGREVQIDAAP